MYIFYSWIESWCSKDIENLSQTPVVDQWTDIEIREVSNVVPRYDVESDHERPDRETRSTPVCLAKTCDDLVVDNGMAEAQEESQS